MEFKRAARLEEGGGIDLETGRFPMVMATEGEARDGHILHVAGLRLPDEMPLQLDHAPTAVANMGTVGEMKLDTKDGVSILRGVGTIRFSGDGAALAARRDVADGIHRGHLRGVSLTWTSTPDSITPRRSLPSSHPAHVSRTNPSPLKRYGNFFASGNAVELSIVAIPSDAGALIGRIASAEDDGTRALWQTIADNASETESAPFAHVIEALESRLADFEQREAQRDAATQASDHTPIELPAFETFMDTLTADIQRHSTEAQARFDDSLADILCRLTGYSNGHRKD